MHSNGPRTKQASFVILKNGLYTKQPLRKAHKNSSSPVHKILWSIFITASAIFSLEAQPDVYEVRIDSASNTDSLSGKMMPAGFGWTRPLPSTSRTTEPTPNVGSAAAVVASRQLSCRRWCCLSPDPVEKVLEQLVQKNGISPVWTRVCSSRSRFDLEKIAKTHRMWIIQGLKGTVENKAIKFKAEGWKCKRMKYFLQWHKEQDGTGLIM